ncbi:tRNA pseudouridine(38-40) synthase TruA [Oceanihabitans sp. 2_MG-2023]|uniref:tRNA pseudouridine(38-40) synthase TruA n=1 Tax=Oceanihabitans sp. 2_MG-2023 TaxID=3062661 RepID=UPI0026E1720E|nr:tRNA pseudouridine(38-40) synthase TruA [Oceanihabitans sp. 2_MG-2023]MDO6597569.1 tRNA pseudouridine(38-40) synthase TruA [Oceanihabitans sp. 2_MG-2023]
MKYFLQLSYNGSAYHGWQNQPNAITVQEVIEKSLSILLKENTAIVGAGRTDAGVHASQMFAHFTTETPFLEKDLVYKLNALLPKDIAVFTVFKVKDDAHARFHAQSRAYLYRISLQKDVFNFDTAYYVRPKLDMDKMQEASQILLQYTDFQCFSKSNTDVNTYNCNIMFAEWKLVNQELRFTIKADRFLRNMVRAIVGTLINVGLGKIEVESLHSIIKSKNRSEAGYSVPGHALYLTEVAYPESIKYDK